MPKTIYISGKISGMEQEAATMFAEAETLLLVRGFKVINPMTLPHQHNRTWHSYMREDIKELCNCDAIYMLPTWKESDGAIIEYLLARNLNLEIIFASKINFSLYNL